MHRKLKLTFLMLMFMLTFGSIKKEKHCCMKYLASLAKVAQLKYLTCGFFRDFK